MVVVADVDLVVAVLKSEVILIAQESIGHLARGASSCVTAILDVNVGPFTADITEVSIVNEGCENDAISSNPIIR